MRTKFNWLYAFVAILCPNFLYAQWNAVYYKTTIIDTAYDIRADKSYSKNSAYPFPEYYYFYHINSINSAIDCSVALNKADFTTGKDEVLVLEKELGTQARLDSSNIAASTRFYTAGIQRYYIYFYSVQLHKWYRKTFEPSFQGFQIPATLAIKDWDKVVAGSTPDKDQLAITVVPANKDWKMIVGDLVIGNQVSYEYTANVPFFKGLTNNDEQEVFNLNSNIVHPIPGTVNGSGLPARIYIKGGEKEDKALLKKLLTACVENYPFYAEKKLSKVVVLKEMDAIFDSGKDYCTLVSALTQYVQITFDDMHFYLENKGKCPANSVALSKSPVRIMDIQKKYTIAANFDTVAYPFHLNDEVLAINGKPVQQVFDSLAHAKYGNTEISPVKTNLIISAILDRAPTDSSLLTVRHNGVITSSVIHYNKKYAIPDNFKPIQSEYRSYPNNIAYFRINAWEPAVYLQFINHLQDFKQASSLIIDLRGNGGGELSTAMQLYSAFINKPSLYFNYVDNAQQQKAVSILPQKDYQLSSVMPVVILGDAVTACASETFIKAMKQRGNTHYLATSPTPGSVASKYDIILPSSLIVHTNSIEYKSCYSNPQDIIETHGIKPDVTVNITRVEDLRPYNDKVMQEAIRYLSADKTGIAENRPKE
ncbi:S41 family peptidase [Chitinophaga sancti]|uniref:S41 family peptidase n=1 Tax=Chitinophaga sancti TaxID=1004 RepID=UPI002A75E88C|nr:S41 family peptidase [Chitinophaga sancti]WPQ65540.1 S41 family peptidase [Chitinophaga sancti]